MWGILRAIYVRIYRKVAMRSCRALFPGRACADAAFRSFVVFRSLFGFTFSPSGVVGSFLFGGGRSCVGHLGFWVFRVRVALSVADVLGG